MMGGMKITEAKEEPPKLARTYEKRLDGRCVAEVTMRTSDYLGRHGSGMLTQPGGKYVSFDPTAVAERIIDPVLVPLIEAFVSEVFALDAAFLETKDSFQDSKGVRWVREERRGWLAQ